MSLIGEQYLKLFSLLKEKHKQDLSTKEMGEILPFLNLFVELEDFKVLNEIVDKFLVPSSSASTMVLVARSLFRLKQHLPSYERNIELCVTELNSQGFCGENLFKGLW